MKNENKFNIKMSTVIIYEVKNEGNTVRDYIVKKFFAKDMESRGIIKNNIIGKSLYEINQKAEESGLVSVFKKALKTGNIEYFPLKEYKNNKLYKWEDNYVLKLYTGEIVSIYNDITSIMQTQEKLLESEKKFRLITENLKDLIYRYTVKPIKCDYLSPSIYDLTGFSIQRFYKDPYLFYKMVHPEDKPRIKKLLLNKIVISEPVDFRLIVKNKKVIHVEMINNPVYDKDKNLIAIEGLARDITKRKKAEEELYNEKEYLRTTLRSIGDGVIATDSNQKVVMLNRIAEKLTGWKNKEAKDKDIDEVFNIVNKKTQKPDVNPAKKVLLKGKTIALKNNIELISKMGKKISIADSAAPIVNKKGNVKGVVLVFRDVTNEQERKEKIEYLSYHDYLTGLYNRRFFEEELMRIDTKRQLPISILVGDLDGLKLVNDVFGHHSGDKLICTIADVIKKCCRAEDVVSRYGGDEFAVLLPQTKAGEVADIKKRILKNSQKKRIEFFDLSISLGYATKEKPEQNILDILKKAENYMYENKMLQSNSKRSSTVNLMQEALHEKSHETEEHAERIKNICRILGKELSIPEMYYYDLELLAVLHDIGKIAIRDSILNKPEPLSEEEWIEMKRHPEIGCRIAQASPELAQIAKYILAHHEKWDGTGYPKKLKGENIPLVSRILIVADSFDAMTNNRPYRKALTKQKAIKEINKNSGIQFDPKVVYAFNNAVKKKLI